MTEAPSLESEVEEETPQPQMKRLPPDLHHWHGFYMGNDNWDASCCMCDDNPCNDVTLTMLWRHILWEIQGVVTAGLNDDEEPPY